MLLASTKIDVQQMQLAVLQQQGGIADRVIGQGVELVFSSVYCRRTGTASPSARAWAKLAGMMTLAILSGAALLAEAETTISNESGNKQVFFNISRTMVSDFGKTTPPLDRVVKAVPAQTGYLTTTNS